MTSSVRRRLAAAACAATLVASLAACTDDADPVSSPTGSAGETTDTTPTEDPTTSSPSPTESESEGEGSGTTVPVYFVTDSDAGPRLVREFHRVQGDPLTEAARLVAGGKPDDPDYRTLWPAVEIQSVYPTDGLLLVQLAEGAQAPRPPGMTKRQARLAVQQLVYTLQGVQQERVPVLVKPMTRPYTLFGLRTDLELTQASPLKTLNLVNITSPTEGQAVSGESLTVSGVANSFEANVICELEAAGKAVATTPFTAEGWMEDRLFPFEGEIPLAEVGEGEVVLRCSTDDPSGGTEGFGPFVDTKTITIG